MHTILVTGSAGFIGKKLISNLTESGYNVIGIDIKTNYDVNSITKNFILSRDICTVIHLAAETSVWNDNHKMIEYNNIRGFIHIFNLCKQLKLRFIYASSSCAVNITSMYGLSKFFDDEYAKIYGWDKCIGLRFHNVFGKQSRKDTLMGIIQTSDNILLYNNGNNYRYFTYIDDIIEGIKIAFKLPRGIYNICNDEQMSIKEFCNIASLYKPIKITYTDEIRKFDKDTQYVNISINNVFHLSNKKYTTIPEGIKLSLS